MVAEIKKKCKKWSIGVLFKKRLIYTLTKGFVE